MHVLVRPWRDRSPEVTAAWLELRRRNPALANPLFHPKFAEIVAMHCDNVELAQISKTGAGIDALLVYQRMKNNIGVAVGDFLSDLHGMICAPEFCCDLRELMRQCRLTALEFREVPVSDRSFARVADGTRPGLRVDLSSGFDAYRRSTHAVKSEQIKFRRIKREIGRLRFTMHDNRDDVFDTLLRWKEEQYKRTGVNDKSDAPFYQLFAVPWAAPILRDVYRTQGTGFAGVLSSLYAGDTLVAAHLGMRSDHVLHHWFPAYDSSLKTYSPGLLLLLKMLEHAPAAGVTMLDFGQGMPEYKARFANAQQTTAYGTVERWSLRYVRKAARRLARDAVVAAGLEKPVRRLYAYFGPALDAHH
jgi:CelD/BcsL family acetyltransferase involved in cellulose biosynthesis